MKEEKLKKKNRKRAKKLSVFLQLAFANDTVFHLNKCSFWHSSYSVLFSRTKALGCVTPLPFVAVCWSSGESVTRRLRTPPAAAPGNPDSSIGDLSSYGMSSIARAIPNNEYFKAAQQLLDEVVNDDVGKV
ncbi:RNA-dependent RNA polymerase family protein [Prunus dulcis]|uniref:RNA-dependent RNA polymerase family protein n=1 Tax=Prunus dulcis TaxID=3755 RepID=A0A4Y1RT97_PRUDU|nr:RNA-dependent RNA polymerase family protein [Prunus dulcis]